MPRTVFLDRDGVINRDRSDSVKSSNEFEFLPGALSALRRLAERGCRVVVVSNQSIIGRGIVSNETIEEVNHRMVREVEAHGGKIEAVFFCPHRPDENCECRKPMPGLLFKARDELGAELSTAILIGDCMTDMEAARAAGCAASILVRSGRYNPQMDMELGNYAGSPVVADDLLHAVELLDYALFRRNAASNRFCEGG